MQEGKGTKYITCRKGKMPKCCIKFKTGIAILLLLYTTGPFFSCKDAQGLKEGSSIGNAMLHTTNYGRYYLNQNKGKVTVLVFWASWCNVCKKELIALEEYKNKLQNENLNILAVCFNPEEIDKTVPIEKSLGITYPLLMDQGASLYKKFGTNSAPITVIIDSKGRISRIIEGFNEQGMRKIILQTEILLENHD